MMISSPLKSKHSINNARRITTRVFVLTHHARQPLGMERGTTFYFVTDGIESALVQARLAAGLLDELEIHVVPLLLGAGARPSDQVDPRKVKLAPIRTILGPGVTHLSYRVIKEVLR